MRRVIGERESVKWTRLTLAEMRSPPLAAPSRADGPTYVAPEWLSPDGGESVPVRYRMPRTREAAIERVARQIAQRTDLNIGWQWSSGSCARYLRFRGWRLLPDDPQVLGE